MLFQMKSLNLNFLLIYDMVILQSKILVMFIASCLLSPGSEHFKLWEFFLFDGTNLSPPLGTYKLL